MIEPSLTPMRIGIPRLLAGVDHRVDLIAVADVAGVQADLVDAGLDRLEGALVVEVDVRHDRHAGLGKDLLERLGVLPLGDRDADHVRPRLAVPLDLRDRRVDLVREAGGHGLDRDGGVAADADDAGPRVAEGDLPGGPSGVHGAGLYGCPTANRRSISSREPRPSWGSVRSRQEIRPWTKPALRCSAPASR